MFTELMLHGVHSVGDSAINSLVEDTGKTAEEVVDDIGKAYVVMAEAATELLLDLGYVIDSSDGEKTFGSLATALSATHVMAAFTIIKQVTAQAENKEAE